MTTIPLNRRLCSKCSGTRVLVSYLGPRRIITDCDCEDGLAPESDADREAAGQSLLFPVEQDGAA